MTPKEELAYLDSEIERLEARRREIYQASVTAPETEKVCDDFTAKMLGRESVFKDLQYPVELRGIHYNYSICEDAERAGRLVKVRPAEASETYLGVYLGRLPLGMSASYNHESGVLAISLGMHNPTMWVPKLNKIVYGCGSWWSFIKSEEDFKAISDQDIDNVWYVKAWKAMQATSVAPPQDPNQ